MANECFNVVRLVGAKDIVDSFINKIVDEEYNVDFRRIIPTPEGIIDIRSWCVENYGLSRYGGFDIDIHENYISFFTAWAPCVEFIINASKLFDLTFTLIYEEPGMDFCGILEVKNGEIIRQEEDECESELSIELFGERVYIEI